MNITLEEIQKNNVQLVAVGIIEDCQILDVRFVKPEHIEQGMDYIKSKYFVSGGHQCMRIDYFKELDFMLFKETERLNEEPH